MSEEVVALQAENIKLRAALAQKSGEKSCWQEEVKEYVNQHVLDSALHFSSVAPFVRKSSESVYTPKHKLSSQEISRYSRHLLVPDLGVAKQEAWQQASVLIIGAGGLAATAALYLAAAGIGRLTIIDDDIVEESNLQRQVIHSEKSLHMPKAVSAGIACAQRSGNMEVYSIVDRFTQHNSTLLIQLHDIIIDATDNVFTRYLINDTAVLCDKPLVSGSALRMEGQLTVYHYNDGPCYRCQFPNPPPSETVTNCSDGGVLGAIPGTIGLLQALETLKILGKVDERDQLVKKLLLFDGCNTSFKTVKLRGRNVDCAVCGDTPSITLQSLREYDTVCMASSHDKPNTNKINIDVEHITPEEYHRNMTNSTPHQLLDVRDFHQYDICQLPDAVNYPFTKMLPRTMAKLRVFLWTQYERIMGPTEYHTAIQDHLKKTTQAQPLPTVTVCRRGVYSALTCKLLQQQLPPVILDNEQQVREQALPPLTFKNYQGGVTRYQQTVDSAFPLY